ncbi:Iron-sulfur cluster carrier protein [Methylobacterium crusticola]|uniref:Iron-sulfur cluster carrier protein n=1 Tax=Methylobacterium crusticola TaxID=1697972 RepID=A0ABQ4R3B3_9HYPH|nr:Mrp/NBP35 family ATP-binding protein [Methylobacterium crusticola]GJD51445.1 Iron-sulfur cluster carrier protein [Methylobacterium crusticola]
MAITRDDVLRALAGVTVGAEGTALPASGRLSEIVVDPSGRVMFSIGIDPAEAAAFEAVRQAAEIAVLKLPGVKAALASLTAERGPGPAPVRPPGPAAGARPAGPPGGAPRPGPALPGVRHIVAVASGKGGVGKSTTACNLALALRAQGLKVGLLDADIYGPSVPKLFGLDQKPETVSTPQGQRIVPLNGYGLAVMSIGFLIAADTAMIWRGPMVQSALTQLLREVVWGELDVLVVDMPPGTGDAQLTLAQATPLAGAVIVSTPQDLALIDARRAVTMFRRVEVPILGVVENMATFVCPHCGGASHIFGHGGARAEAQALGVPFLGEVPLTMAIRESSDAGRPVVATDPDGPQAAAYRAIAAGLWANLTGAPAGRQPPRIVIE